MNQNLPHPGIRKGIAGLIPVLNGNGVAEITGKGDARAEYIAVNAVGVKVEAACPGHGHVGEIAPGGPAATENDLSGIRPEPDAATGGVGVQRPDGFVVNPGGNGVRQPLEIGFSTAPAQSITPERGLVDIVDLHAVIADFHGCQVFVNLGDVFFRYHCCILRFQSDIQQYQSSDAQNQSHKLLRGKPLPVEKHGYQKRENQLSGGQHGEEQGG